MPDGDLNLDNAKLHELNITMKTLVIDLLARSMLISHVPMPFFIE